MHSISPMYLNSLATLCAILTAVSAAGYFIYKEYRKKQLRYRKKLQGYWTNEGNIILSKYETHFITVGISIDLEDGELSGVINSTEKGTENVYMHISLQGRLRYKRAKIVLSVIKQGRVIEFGKAMIKIIGIGKKLKWRILKDDNNMFPEYTILWKTSSSEINDMP